MVELAPVDTPIDDVLKLAGVIAGCGFFRQHLELRFDDIVDVRQHHGGALDDLFRRDEVRLIFLALRDAHGGAPENFAFYLVAPNGGELDGVQNVDAADMPAYSGVIIQTFNYTARGGRGGDIVAYTLDFHLSACE